MHHTTCSIEDCTKRVKARGWCQTHYVRFVRHGSPHHVERHTVLGTPEVRFWAKVDKGGANGCWVWTASTFRNRNGYGKFNAGSSHDGNRTVYAHRFSFESVNGKIPDGLDVLHSCDNPPCVNPDHLRLGTAADNAGDMVRRRRDAWATGKRKATVGCSVDLCDRKHKALGMCKSHYERHRVANKSRMANAGSVGTQDEIV